MQTSVSLYRLETRGDDVCRVTFVWFWSVKSDTWLTNRLKRVDRDGWFSIRHNFPSPAAPVCAGHSTPPVRHSQPHFTATQELSTQSLEAPFPPLPFKTHHLARTQSTLFHPCPDTNRPTKSAHLEVNDPSGVVVVVVGIAQMVLFLLFPSSCPVLSKPAGRRRRSLRLAFCLGTLRPCTSSLSLFRLHFHSSPTYFALATPPM